MHKILMVLLIVTMAQARAEDGLWRDAGQACVFGGSVLGITSILVLYPAMAVGTNSIPVVSLILGNTLFGCGIAAIGASAAYGFGRAYDRVFTPDPVQPSDPPQVDPLPSPPAAQPLPQSFILPPAPAILPAVPATPADLPPTIPTPPPGMVQTMGATRNLIA